MSISEDVKVTRAGIVPEPVPPPQPGRNTVGTLTVLETVYHAVEGAQPTAAESRYSRQLLSDEVPYCRRVKVGPEWAPLDAGWVERPSIILLVNEREPRQRQPTAAERALDESLVIEVGYLPPSTSISPRDMHSGPKPVPPLPLTVLVIPPGESARFKPSDLGSLRLRCRAGAVKCHLSAFPE